MKDRTPRYPGRVKLNPVSGQANVYDMSRADQPIEDGTPINKSTLLTDETAHLLEIKIENPTPDDAFSHIARNFTGDGGMNINLLEEAIHMKYCKVLTLQEESTKESVFLSDAAWSLGCKSTSNGWTVIAKNSLDAPNLIQFQSTLSNGTAKNFSLEIGQSFFPARNDAVSYHFYGYDGLCTVQNKPNEVCLLIAGYTCLTYPSGSSTTSTNHSWRIWAIFDVTTGAKKAASVAYTTGSSGYYCYANGLSRASQWCYYNSTYGYYYAPWNKSPTSSSYGYIYCMVAGHDYLGASSDSGATSISNTFMGRSSSDYSYASYCAYIDNSTILQFEIRPNNYIYLYKHTLSSATGTTRTQIASSTSIPTFSSSWAYSSTGHIHALKTASNQLYIYCVGQASTTTATEYNVLNRYGPFTISTTSLSEASHYKRMLGYPSTISYSHLYPIANVSNNPDSLMYCLSANMNNTEVQYFQLVNSTTAYRAITPYLDSSKVSNRSLNLAAGMMRPIFCCDNSFSWMFLGSADRISSFSTPTSNLVGATRYWTCPEDGTYKIILVGGGAAGGASNGGGSGYLKVVTKQYNTGDRVAYVVGMGQEVYNATYSWMYRTTDRSTRFDDEVALCGSGQIGGANGYGAAEGGGGGGYNLVTFGGNGQLAEGVPTANGGQGTVVPAAGYGAGGAAGMNGSDGVIVIVR